MSLTLTLHSISGLKGHGDRVAKITFRGRILLWLLQIIFFFSKNCHTRRDYCKIAAQTLFSGRNSNGLLPPMSKMAMSSKSVSTTASFLGETRWLADLSWSSKKLSKSVSWKSQKRFWTIITVRCRQQSGAPPQTPNRSFTR